MRALHFEQELRFEPDYPERPLAPGEARVRVTAAGICNTDLEIVRGYMGFRGVPGHEFVGVVEQSPDPAWIGRRVAGEINAACACCATCTGGAPTHCPHRSVLGILGRDGAFADTLDLPLANLHPLPDDLPDEHAIFIEPVAAGFEILEQRAVRPTDRVLVLGDGKLGLLVAQVLALTGCRLTVLGRHAAKLGVAQKLGLEAGLTADYDGARADVVVDCTGSAAGFEQALRWTRPRGTLVLKSTVAEGAPLNLAPVVIDEIRVLGSRCGPFPPAIRALARGDVRVALLLHASYPLEEGVAAFEHAARPGVLKVLLWINGRRETSV